MVTFSLWFKVTSVDQHFSINSQYSGQYMFHNLLSQPILAQQYGSHVNKWHSFTKESFVSLILLFIYVVYLPSNATQLKKKKKKKIQVFIKTYLQHKYLYDIIKEDITNSPCKRGHQHFPHKVVTSVTSFPWLFTFRGPTVPPTLPPPTAGVTFLPAPSASSWAQELKMEAALVCRVCMRSSSCMDSICKLETTPTVRKHPLPKQCSF